MDRIGVKSLLGSFVGFKQRNLSARIGVKSLRGGAGFKQRNLSARIGVKSLLGGAGFKQPNLSTRIGVKSLLGSVGTSLKQRNLLRQDLGKIVSLGGAGAIAPF